MRQAYGAGRLLVIKADLRAETHSLSSNWQQQHNKFWELTGGQKYEYVRLDASHFWGFEIVLNDVNDTLTQLSVWIVFIFYEKKKKRLNCTTYDCGCSKELISYCTASYFSHIGNKYFLQLKVSLSTGAPEDQRCCPADLPALRWP